MMWFGAYVRFVRIVKGQVICLRYRPFRTAMVRAALFPTGYHGLSQSDDPAFVEALWVASPSLAADVELLAGKPDELSAKRRRATTSALAKYLLRAGARATPFGAFAGVAPADWADELRCELGPVDRHRRVARLDHGAAMRTARAAERDPSTRDGLRVLANPASYVLGGRLVLPYRLPDDDGEIGEQVSVRLTGPLVRALRRAQTPIAYPELRAELHTAFPGTAPIRIEQLLGTLLDQEVLISTARPPLTPDDPALTLGDLPLSTAIAEYQAQPLGSGLAALRAAYAVAGRTGRGQVQRDVAVDVALDADVTLPHELAGELDTALTVLARLGTDRPDLGGYRAEFAERYGVERVPLLELLDQYSGLGPPADYRNPPSTRDSSPPAPPRRDREDFLARLIDEALRAGAVEVRLDPAEVADAVAQPPGTPAESLDVFVRLGRAADGDWFAVLGSGSTPAGRAFGRFSQLDPRFAEVVAEVAELERATHPGRAFAGLTYAHARGHLNNVGIVPPVHDWQIAVGTTAGVPAERQLRLADLEVFLSGGRFALTARGLERELVVRAPNLLSFAEAPNAVRFALAVGMANTLPTEWSWGEFERLPFLPRVRVGRIVLSPARWRLPKPDGLDDWRAKRAVPRFVQAGSYDNRLLLDLDQPAHQALLRQEIARGVEFVTEALPALDEAPAEGPGGRHVLEAVVPLRLVEPVISPPSLLPAPRGPGARVVLPGEEWTYAKLYGPPNLREQALRALHTAFAGQDWFFVRYLDPVPHLRVRVRDGVAVPAVLAALRACVTNGLIRWFRLEGYERELERYGGAAGLAVAEQIFVADTRTLLSAPPADPDDVPAAVTGIEVFLAGLGLDVPARRAVYARLVSAYAGEHADNPTVGPARLAGTFQRHQPQLRALLTSELTAPHRELGAALPGDVDVLCSLAHMHANRHGLTRVAEYRAVSLLHRGHNDVARLAGHAG